MQKKSITKGEVKVESANGGGNVDIGKGNNGGL